MFIKVQTEDETANPKPSCQPHLWVSNVSRCADGIVWYCAAAAPEMTPVRRMCRLPRPPKPWGRVRVKKGCFSSDVASYRPPACIRVDEPSHTGSLLHRSPYAAVSLPRKILHHAFSSSPEKNLHFHLSPVPPTYTITTPAMHNHRESR